MARSALRPTHFTVAPRNSPTWPTRRKAGAPKATSLLPLRPSIIRPRPETMADSRPWKIRQSRLIRRNCSPTTPMSTAISSRSRASARVFVDVIKHNTPPIAAGELLDTNRGQPILENNPIVIDPQELLANDMDHENDSLSIISVGHSFGGSARLLNNGTVLFTPAANFYGDASFEYTVSDGSG